MISERLGAERPGNDTRQVDNAKPVERATRRRLGNRISG
jgi:hypothetical protein